MDQEYYLHLSSLVSSRICHDLLAPVSGAVLATSMLEDSKISPDVTELIKSSIETLSKKLQFFRAAFSFSKGHSTPLIREAKSVATMVFETPKHALEWNDAPFYDLEFEGDWARLVLNLSLIAHECLPKGGILKTDLTNIPNKVSIDIEGPLITFNEDILSSLHGNSSEANVRNLTAKFSKLILEKLNLRLEITRSDKTCAFLIQSC